MKKRATQPSHQPSSPSSQTRWNQPTLPWITLHNGTLEGLKWLALILMTVDHVNKYLFNGATAWMFDAGRSAMPLFIFVLAYNLARPNTMKQTVYIRTATRLLIFGAISTPVFIALGGVTKFWCPLNILFTLMALTLLLFLIEKNTISHFIAGATLFLAAGSSVEFGWPALLFGIAVWFYCQQPSWASLVSGLLGLLAFNFINNNLWAIAALPVILLSPRINLPIPRLRWVFYFYYPVHLMVIWLIRIPMSKAGYLFF